MLSDYINPAARPIQVKSLQVQSGMIHYEAAGRGEPIVLLHGLSGSGRWWQRNVPFLAEHFRVYVIDMIGFGRSRGQEFFLDQAHHAILEWMDHLNIERAHVVGHSMGGYITIALAANHPDRVDKIVLVDALALPMNRSLLHNAARLIHSLRYTPLNFMPVLLEDAALAGPSTLIKAGREVLNADIRNELHRIQSPAMIVWGEKDTLLPLQIGKMLKRHMPSAEMYIINGAGHNPMWDRPEEFNEVVRAFLKSR